MTTLGSYALAGPGKVGMVLTDPLPQLLASAAEMFSGQATTGIRGPGPAAVAARSLAAADPLMVLEAEYVAADLETAVAGVRGEQDAFAARYLKAIATRAELVTVMSPDQLLLLSGWCNRLYIASRAGAPGGDVEVGEGQSAFEDAELNSLLGAAEPDPQDPSSDDQPGLGILSAILAVLSTELLVVHNQMENAAT